MDRARRPGVTVGGFVTWSPVEGLDWLKRVPDGAEFGLSFTDERHNRYVEELLGRRTHHQGGSAFDIMVTFTDGLGETASKLTLTAEFARQESPEGVALVNDRLNQHIRSNLDQGG